MATLRGAPGSAADTLFRRKRRRFSSPKKATDSAIYFPIESNKKISAELSKCEDNKIGFADKVLVLDRKLRLVPYQLVMIERRFLLFKDSSGNKKISRSYRDIEKICVSHQSDNFLLFKCKNTEKDSMLTREPAILMVSRRKFEIIQFAVRQTTGENSNFLSVADRFGFLLAEGKGPSAPLKRYVAVFTRTEFGVQTSLYLDAPVKKKQRKRREKDSKA